MTKQFLHGPDVIAVFKQMGQLETLLQPEAGAVQQDTDDSHGPLQIGQHRCHLIATEDRPLALLSLINQGQEATCCLPRSGAMLPTRDAGARKPLLLT